MTETTLSYVEVRFSTRDGNKDSDTKVIVTVLTRDGGVVGDRAGWDNLEFDEGQWTDRVNLDLHGGSWKRSALKNGTMKIRIEPDGNDDWDSRTELRFHWADGTVDETGPYDFDLDDDAPESSAPLGGAFA